ncbi:MAG: hypothetical protein NUW01_08985 [Gemmatimonadaceae bacterium]|nr:hypothetical protein [Gemmatimonadaceae bacterium]
MIVLPDGHDYPEKFTRVVPFPAHPSEFPSLLPQPPGLVEESWPPAQLTYLGVYLGTMGCKTIVHESHYIDKDYIEDLALFYGRSLRNYPNYCQRLHFFADAITEEEWRAYNSQTGDKRAETEKRLQKSYLGFSVIRPLPGSPVGRTVLRTFGPTTKDAKRREFGAIRKYRVHIGGFSLAVWGLAFQQQDRGVSACATTALWCALQKVAPMEEVGVVSPAAITESASKYLLAGGRALPSEGLTIHQVCEATRAAGLSPLVIRSVAPEHERAQLLGYLSSGFAPVLALQPLTAEDGHAVCCVGLKLGAITPPSDPNEHFCDGQNAVHGLYIHDDRLGPYASAELFPHTLSVGGVPRIVTGVKILWPDGVLSHTAILAAIVVPVPTKLRLTITRMRQLGIPVASAVGQLLPQFDRIVTLSCYFKLGVTYLRESPEFGLSSDSLYSLTSETVLSRYVGVIALTVAGEPLLDILLDATESGINPAVLACVQRKTLPDKDSKILEFIASKLATRFLR